MDTSHAADYISIKKYERLEARIAELEAENKRLVDIAGDALGFSPYQRDRDTVEVLAHHAKRLAEELAECKDERDKLKEDIDTENTELANRAVAKIKKAAIDAIAGIGSSYWIYRTEDEWNALRARCERLVRQIDALYKQ